MHVTDKMLEDLEKDRKEWKEEAKKKEKEKKIEDNIIMQKAIKEFFENMTGGKF